MKLSAYVTDGDKELNGVWYALDHMPPGKRGFGEVKVARINNKRFNQKLREMQAAATVRGVKRGVQSDEDWVEIYAETILMDWRNFEDDEGEDLPYSQEAAKKALANKDFFRDITTIAKTMEAYRVDQREEDVKNS